MLVCICVIDSAVNHVGDGIEDDETTLVQFVKNVHCSKGKVDDVLKNRGLRNSQVINIHTQLPHIRRIKCIFSVNVDDGNALLLSMADRQEALCRLTRGLLTKDFTDAATRPAPNADSHIKGQGASPDDLVILPSPAHAIHKRDGLLVIAERH